MVVISDKSSPTWYTELKDAKRNKFMRVSDIGIDEFENILELARNSTYYRYEEDLVLLLESRYDEWAEDTLISENQWETLQRLAGVSFD